MTSPPGDPRTTHERVVSELQRVYPQHDADQQDLLAQRILQEFGVVETSDRAASPSPSSLGSDETVLITYGDTFQTNGKDHLESLVEIWNTYLNDVFSTVHVLPFFPSSSDGGFAVSDYRTVDPALGSWRNLQPFVSGGALMVDLVCNHGSAQSAWFAEFVQDQPPGRDMFVTVDPDDDLEMVVRPRTHPLVLPVETAAGTRHVWATFSHDQVDFDFANPDVLVEFCSILGDYMTHGATRVRLDAIAYLWKQVGTPCIHLPETHAVVRIMRALVEARDPNALLITETNVPHADNVSYFGASDEAHVVYNFTLAPLIAWSLVVGEGTTLSRWLGELDEPPPGCAFLNFLASHDGIGLRPVEDLIPAQELAPLVDAAVATGGAFSEYSTQAGPRPYELNVSLADLLAGVDGGTAERYLVAHTLMLAIQGIPAFYIHSMLSSPGDTEAVAASGHRRDINRSKISLDHAHDVLTRGWRGATFAELARRIRLRRSIDAFGPASPQRVVDLGPAVVALERGHGDDAVLAVHNMTGEAVAVDLPAMGEWFDELTQSQQAATITLAPWQAMWLTPVS